MGFNTLFSGPLAALRAAAGDQVSYVRGESSIDDLIAAKGTSRHDVAGENGVLTEVTSQDFLFSAADLVIDDSAILPQAGDSVIEVISGKTYTYRVTEFNRQKCWYYSDPGNTQIRVHTIMVDIE